MKKLILLTFLVTFSITHAQEELNLDYNKWSLEIAGGFHKPTRPFANGYYTETPSFGQFSLGARYMFNDRFGLKLDFGYSTLKEGNNSLPFQGNYYRSSLQGVANVGSLLRFEGWTNTIGLLAHAGGGYSMLSPQKPIELDKNDGMVNLIVGISPQIRLGNSVAFTTDVSLIGHVGQNHTWDGTQASTIRGFDGMLMNFSAGLTFYLGANKKHADWSTRKEMLNDILDDFENRISKIETDLIDSDQDGVPDYLDREPNTPSGVAVDTKGRAIDLNKNGIPDEMEAGLDARYLKKEEAAALAGGTTTVEDLLNKGYVNVYFQFNSDKPETYSLDAINYLVKYMKDHPSAKAELVGFSDEIGNVQYNQTLSEKRAKRVYDIFLATGVSADRLTYRGGGEDTSVDKSSSPARQLVRRVTFRLK